MKFKNIVITFSLFLSAAFACAENDWQTDFEAALAEAKAQKKFVLVNFTGSDWCGWCIKLDKEVFSKDAFKKFAESELVLVEIDFPRKKTQSKALKAQNEALADRYGIRGFPTILLLSQEGEMIGKTGYKDGGPEAYVAHLQKIISK